MQLRFADCAIDCDRYEFLRAGERVDVQPKVWAFLRLARMNAEEFSAEAHEIADIVANDIQCDEIRPKAGTTTTDVRQRGDRRYDVMIRWDCTDLRIIVRDPDGKAGTARTPRPECCS